MRGRGRRCALLLALLAPGAPGAAAAAPAPPARVAVVAVGAGSAALADRVVQAGRARTDVALVRFTAHGLAPEPEAPAADIERLLRAASEAFDAFDLPSAKASLAEASALLAPHARTAPVVAMERQALTLQISLAHAARDDRGLDRALAEYAARFPAAPARAPWPPAIAQRLARKLPARDASLSIRADAPDASVELDGEPLGRLPVAITQLAPGPHRLRARAPGRLPTDEVVILEPGTGADLTLVLPVDLASRLAELDAREPLPEDVERALLAAAETERAVLVEATPPGATLSMAASGATGSAVVEVPSQTPAELGRALDALFGPLPEDPAAAPPIASPGIPTWAWIALGAGAATAGGGVGLRVSAVSTERALFSREGALTQTEAYAMQGSAESKATAGTVLIALGVAALAGVGAYLFYGGED